MSETLKTNFDTYLAEQLTDPAFAERFERAGREWDLALQLAAHRLRAGLSQNELAERVGTTQQQISRLESSSYRGHSLRMINRVADALGVDVVIALRPRKPRAATAKSEKQGSRTARQRSGPTRASVRVGVHKPRRPLTE